MALDTDTVRRIARLARIHVDDAELAPLADELNNILGWIEQLDEVDTDGVAPMTSVVEMVQRLRADEMNDGDRQEDVLANAPDPADAFFTVPKVVE
ncbi:MAG: Asp-tRNA(Asn)/Glu-tRNA(Gln) amidotransferase subunit GatC [Rhodospirillaceae bacterium]|jgi:aspartyl-tRNA(Asn)/glutamyl-tRNA(Gln) amidotransferase subunit C|nr:Asp-tRNA(Asn)/Glu-tRNA(Gln) amidotransferase subunit GatC [Rhodospirillaceae bacterium]MBT3811164.1 Asp-tRNA(Asn)/Glu-tRNA(Gln) amidotransferase subunit GatC [Rhodospirillaceae bacterium]MBT3931699.1 Asp-tRNA(Asn)/Glu-tRNA(Gln) amidotransferase subunit GatC [Rhodospirillaceae bacterium]MBT4773910.1 Asp-tRNA(Asn)/Glu-tRNA(Gln) amidotransferase subunit GatC [Rhodospirillaceae bacterium]MBT5357477.1 Asp-tRNA(Asn)/Glu-tRNA(Gln) amidotransferase subunit GatC [Rhodospirillaceae bacterium]